MQRTPHPVPPIEASSSGRAAPATTPVAELSGEQLLRAVELALGMAGPIDIEALLSRERIRTQPMPGVDSWLAQYSEAQTAHDGSKRGYFAAWGASLQEAALRCVVLRALGPRVHWPASNSRPDSGDVHDSRVSVGEICREDAAERASAECFELALPEIGQAESYQRDLLRLVQAARDVAGRAPHHLVHELQAALEQLEPWLEQDAQDDARAMGWVDSRGRP